MPRTLPRPGKPLVTKSRAVAFALLAGLSAWLVAGQAIAQSRLLVVGDAVVTPATLDALGKPDTQTLAAWPSVQAVLTAAELQDERDRPDLLALSLASFAELQNPPQAKLIELRIARWRWRGSDPPQNFPALMTALERQIDVLALVAPERSDCALLIKAYRAGFARDPIASATIAEGFRRRAVLLPGPDDDCVERPNPSTRLALALDPLEGFSPLPERALPPVKRWAKGTVILALTERGQALYEQFAGAISLEQALTDYTLINTGSTDHQEGE